MSLPPPPRANTALVGHDAAAAALEEAARAGRLHHAWLLAGAPGIGKATLAYRFARWLLAGRPAPRPGEPPLAVDPRHPAVSRIAAGTHPDLLTVAPNAGEKGRKEVIRADDARAAVRFLAHTAAEGGWRVVVVDEAERTERDVAPNILLKTLEEPPPRTVLLLVTDVPSRLLPTIRSRCRRLDLAPLPDAALAPLLARWLPDLPAGERDELLRLAEGSPGRALQLADAEGLELHRLVAATLALLPRGDRRHDLAVAEKVAGRRDAAAFATFVSLLRRALAAALGEAARGGEAASWLGHRPLAEWAALWDKLGSLAEETERLNLDRKQAVLTGLGWLPTP
ncbi:DNA polymerase III subunit delta' [Roseomonas sp. NAR14]|uniref:DNA polymerase III subunit delta n=1 Tax=Roseomonas acroporae TaxID=2937791 RepID=A0A9X2BU48_9PROT|nr:DNA polymerase III subunit delta' [Roseomonas acroporae]MCK8783731.1 DNA polymerase III subunit delta' [Roseomonas acroporae]